MFYGHIKGRPYNVINISLCMCFQMFCKSNKSVSLVLTHSFYWLSYTYTAAKHQA